MGLDMDLFEVPTKYGTEVNKTDEELAKTSPEKMTLIGFDDELPTTRYYYRDGVLLVAQWRKANQIHRWFVENVQEGIDECEPHIVLPETLVGLYQRCVQVRDDPSKAPELLPSQSGFFFGRTDYDDWYRADIVDTIAALDRVLLDRRPNTHLVYRSSW